jgi:hypothetical protein
MHITEIIQEETLLDTLSQGRLWQRVKPPLGRSYLVAPSLSGSAM